MKGSHASSSMINPRDITDSVSIVTTHIEETSLWPSQLARSTFMKESKDSKYYHYLENAMCDLRSELHFVVIIVIPLCVQLLLVVSHVHIVVYVM